MKNLIKEIVVITCFLSFFSFIALNVVKTGAQCKTNVESYLLSK